MSYIENEIGEVAATHILKLLQLYLESSGKMPNDTTSIQQAVENWLCSVALGYVVNSHQIWVSFPRRDSKLMDKIV